MRFHPFLEAGEQFAQATGAAGEEFGHDLHHVSTGEQGFDDVDRFMNATGCREAEADLVTEEAEPAQTQAQIAFYMANAKLLHDGLDACGFTVFGGVHAPYLWLRTPGGATSWEFFDRLLDECQVVGTPGAGFGPAGEGYFRLSAFNSRANIEEALGRIRRVFG